MKQEPITTNTTLNEAMYGIYDTYTDNTIRTIANDDNFRNSNKGGSETVNNPIQNKRGGAGRTP